MTIDRSRLLATVEKLRAQLEAAEGLDANVISGLRSTIADIETAIEAQDQSAAHRAPSLSGRLSTAATEFEVSHPTLASAIGSVVDALAGMGI